MTLFHKLMLIIMAMQLNIVIFFLNLINAGNEPVYRFKVLREFLAGEMFQPKDDIPSVQNKEI